MKLKNKAERTRFERLTTRLIRTDLGPAWLTVVALIAVFGVNFGARGAEKAEVACCSRLLRDRHSRLLVQGTGES